MVGSASMLSNRKNGDTDSGTQNTTETDVGANNQLDNAGSSRRLSAEELELAAEEEGHELTDSEGEDEFVRKYGDINFQYIKRPRDAVWFIRPQALNYFKDGVLYRTKGERSSSKIELFLDLLYVGLVANLAGYASEKASGAALLEYFLLFVPVWVVWSDVKDFVNYYYNEDLSQKTYLLWIIVLLTLYVNSHEKVLENRKGAALTIVPYIICRLSLAVSLCVYSVFVAEHRVQQRIYSASLVVTSLLWLIVIFVSTRAKIGVSIALMFLEQVCFCLAFHPWTKKKLNLNMSTALNIEHEVERYSVFVTIAIGEFLYKVVASSPLGPGFSARFARGVFMIIIAYVLFWIYNNGSTTKKAVHALRNKGSTAMGWMYAHLPLVAAIVLSADSAGEITEYHNVKLKKGSRIIKEVGGEKEEGASLYALSFFFTGGICVSLVCMGIIGLMDKPKDPPDLHILPRFWRVVWRIPIGIAIVCLSFAELDSTILMGIVTILLVVLLVFESVTSTPKTCLAPYSN
ncbi:Piso0_003402 [Millerozyma farinosa CBS 7064]|uniref:Piso0_003402 protein n=1 Tax=Pichia sorbitophila (strain ATCC MYA-4447 / BCRC 22081 / CBS 7064 / NBRC 10061 / NRRL Y-12695) TaxID=559304 RepID=G8YIZ4_PICSO|nr:Piso0_003402 [Millerozyma farinosa CBS 7064]CCE81054.1 Piso0_003402 [Millerozyma farinosa CBS 7064]